MLKTAGVGAKDCCEKSRKVVRSWGRKNQPREIGNRLLFQLTHTIDSPEDVAIQIWHYKDIKVRWVLYHLWDK